GGALVPASFLDFHREVRHWTGGTDQSREIQIVATGIPVLVVIAALVALAYLIRPLGDGPTRNPFARLAEVFQRQWLPLALVMVMAALALLGYTEDAMTATVLANLAMV